MSAIRPRVSTSSSYQMGWWVRHHALRVPQCHSCVLVDQGHTVQNMSGHSHSHTGPISSAVVTMAKVNLGKGLCNPPKQCL